MYVRLVGPAQPQNDFPSLCRLPSGRQGDRGKSSPLYVAR